MRKKFILPKPLSITLLIFLFFLLLCLGFLVYLTIREYAPAESETLSTENLPSKTLSVGDSLSILTYNVGYCADDKDHDFFMDGGKTVTTESKDSILNNISGISSILQKNNPDVVFLQEVDIDSKRSHHINESTKFASAVKGTTSAFATNYKCDYIPYPLPSTIGSVHGGLQTLNKFSVSEAQRISLPVSYSWPVRLCQLKRCLLVERVPIENSDKEMVFINLHLEAYASGDAKTRQTEILTSLLEEEYAKGNYCIAGGDFNQTFSNVDVTQYPVINSKYFVADSLNIDVLPKDWQFVTDNATPTSRLLNEPYNPQSPNTQYYVIDGYILSPNLALEQVTTLDTGFAYSDHNPVLLKLSLKE